MGNLIKRFVDTYDDFGELYLFLSAVLAAIPPMILGTIYKSSALAAGLAGADLTLLCLSGTFFLWMVFFIFVEYFVDTCKDVERGWIPKKIVKLALYSHGVAIFVGLAVSVPMLLSGQYLAVAFAIFLALAIPHTINLFVFGHYSNKGFHEECDRIDEERAKKGLPPMIRNLPLV